MLGFAKIEAVRGADRNACRAEALVNTVHAIITLNHLAEFRMPLGCSPWACGNAGLTTHTKVMIHKNNSILWPSLHRSRWARSNAPGIFTMKTGHKDVRCTRVAVKEFGSDSDYLARPRLWWQTFIALANNFARMTADTFILVLQQEVFAHRSPPSKIEV
jgi:hypothetical protein